MAENKGCRSGKRDLVQRACTIRDGCSSREGEERARARESAVKLTLVCVPISKQNRYLMAAVVSLLDEDDMK